ncbi:MAG: cytochrome c [Gammaproteobacteria bacterium]|nr:cytochrome c [Gammaproteobacteria bacterium]
MKNPLALPIFLVALTAIWSVPVCAADTDSRQLVEMPPEARAALRTEMLGFQTALHLIIGALAEQQFTNAADIAEKQMGISAMGSHRNAPQNARPGAFMPTDMHAIARMMHAASSEFAKVASSGETTKALASLQAVTATCITCHRSYRTQ